MLKVKAKYLFYMYFFFGGKMNFLRGNKAQKEEKINQAYFWDRKKSIQQVEYSN